VTIDFYVLRPSGLELRENPAKLSKGERIKMQEDLIRASGE
jgi:hypothetical protein